tara:strand:+ start:752 stop:1165 length:414 start_codon:yes stop_codon:yes gene_type:complete
MAVFKDTDDTRTYANNTNTSFDWRIPTTINSSTGAATPYNWPGKVATINVANQFVAPFLSTIYSSNAADLHTDTTSGGSFTDKAADGHTGLTSGGPQHCLIPGLHLVRGTCSESSGTVYWKIKHATDNSSSQSHTKD